MLGEMMAVIQYLRLDADYDPTFVPLASLTDLEAVRQAIMTRLALFEGEWWENLTEGTPMFQSILGASGSARSRAAIGLALAQRISGTPYVSAVDEQVIEYDQVARKLTYSAVAQTSFGPIPITVSPGSSASLGGA
jgi:hypothetical protein